MTALLERVKEVEGQQVTDSHTSSKSPSSDGPRQVPRSLRGTSGQKPGGQREHPGTSLRLVDTPDRREERRQVLVPIALRGRFEVSVRHLIETCANEPSRG